MPKEQITFEPVTKIQILDEHGNLDKELEPEISSDDLLKLYRAMVLAREGDQRSLKLQRQGRIGTFGPSTGHEAACAVGLLLQKKDWLFTALREYGLRLMRGEPIENPLYLWNGYEEGQIFDGGDRTFTFTVVLASQLPPAVGVAYAMKMKGEKDTVVVAFMGDGATSEGDFHEALNFASTWQLPVVFICQNNQYAISTPLKKQTHSRTLAQKAIAYDMPGVQVDGNDPLAVYAATKEAIDRARSGGGPSFIENFTYRLMMHTTSDDPTKYRSTEEVDMWAKRDPLIRFKKYLENKGLWNDQKENKLQEEIKNEIDDAVKRFESRTDFKPDAPFDYVFRSKNYQIEEQREQFLEELRRDSQNG
jgi:pyruvate dehydrogenase E1 component alpha subunit